MQTPVVGVRGHGRDDGVVGPFPRGVRVGVRGVEAEVRAAVLQREAAAPGDDAGAETAVVAVDEAAAVAVLVCDGEVDGVALVVCGTAVGEGVGGFVGVEEVGARGEVGAGDEGAGGDVGAGGVRDEPCPVCEGNA